MNTEVTCRKVLSTEAERVSTFTDEDGKIQLQSSLMGIDIEPGAKYEFMLKPKGELSLFTRRDLVEFGNYLLSDERTGGDRVSHADVENFLES